MQILDRKGLIVGSILLSWDYCCYLGTNFIRSEDQGVQSNTNQLFHGLQPDYAKLFT